MFAFCEDTTWFSIVDYIYISDSTTVISCFNECVKRFFGYAKYDSITDVFSNLGVANAQSRLHSLYFNFANHLWRCHNPLLAC